MNYHVALDHLNTKLSKLTRYIELLKRFPPGIYNIERSGGVPFLAIIKNYAIPDNGIDMQIIAEIIADEEFTADLLRKTPMYISSIDKGYYRLTPVTINDIPLFISYKSKSKIFEKIIQTGKLPSLTKGGSK
jgi:hypothetical protein